MVYTVELRHPITCQIFEDVYDWLIVNAGEESVDYRYSFNFDHFADKNVTATYVFTDPQTAMLFKLTWL